LAVGRSGSGYRVRSERADPFGAARSPMEKGLGGPTRFGGLRRSAQHDHGHPNQPINRHQREEV
jgi:hypothetical protein